MEVINDQSSQVMGADSGDMAERSAPGLPYQIQYFQPPPYPHRTATSSSPFLVNCAAVPSTLLPPCPSPKATSQFLMSAEGAAHLFKERDTTKLQYGKANCRSNGLRGDPRTEVHDLHRKSDVLTARQSTSNPYGHAGSVPTVIPAQGKYTTTFTADFGHANDAAAIQGAESSHLGQSSDFQRCLIKHGLCRPPKDLTPNEQIHYYVNAFLPGPTLVAKHVLSDLLRQHDTPTQRFMIPALMNLYLEQRKEKMIEPSDTRRADEVVIYQTNDNMAIRSSYKPSRCSSLHDPCKSVHHY
ncbi:hypothetical protein HO173_003507 [Letharia columbiana]|uniref:Uncharacterized protein n=1 Tax=Letharia columbiana TaxID=112416 RepID=A0A8H6G0Q2_9LECA|nr:uncharacterized protein HO173_003507 [Letharia columbiana]KAF6238227.1 hypothetical protein HO173_003507 [Letharia columbiana]